MARLNIFVKIQIIVVLGLAFVLYSCSSSSDESNPNGSDDQIEPNPISFNSFPQNQIDHNRMYSYQVLVNNSDGNEVTLNVDIPSWLTFDNDTNTISGLADWDNVGLNFNVSIDATSNGASANQSFVISVNLGEIICNQDFGDPSISEYILPWNIGEEYVLSQSYCPTNPNWGHYDWFAYDFDMPVGTELIASRGGQVIGTKESNVDLPPNQADCSGGKENYVFILHDDNTVMSYVHLMQNGVAVNVGDTVSQGDVIGYSGNSGCTIGPHTHIALFRTRFNYDRQSTIPFNYLNTDGLLDSNNGLVQGMNFKAL